MEATKHNLKKYIVDVTLIPVLILLIISGVQLHISRENHIETAKAEKYELGYRDSKHREHHPTFGSNKETDFGGIAETSFHDFKRETKGWEFIHQLAAILFLALMLIHIYHHWNWYRTVIGNHKFRNNKVLVITLLFFILLLISSVVMWGHFLPGHSVGNIGLIHFWLGLILFGLLIVHVLQRMKWISSTTKKIAGLISLFLVCFQMNSFSNPYTGPLVDDVSGTIKGVIIDSESSKPVEFANIVLFRASDSSIVSGMISDEKGAFLIKDVPYDRYYAIASFIGYKKSMVNDIILKKENSIADLGNIMLEAVPNLLDEVIVTGQKQQMEVKFEKKVFNVGTDISNRGENAIDILSNVPSVEVDMEGGVSLRGSQNLQILIDGKPSAMTKSTKGLEQLQGNLIDKIEVISVPSARYDASGEAGIINIVLKKTKERGIHGTFDLNAGNPANYGGSYSLNYRMNKINLFSNLGLNYRLTKGYGYSYQDYHGADTSYIYRQENTFTMKGLSLNYSLGLDYYLSDKNIVTLSMVNEIADEIKKRNIIYSDYNFENELTNTIYRNAKESNIENNVDVSLSYKKLFANKDQILTAEFKWIQSTEPEKADITQTSVSDTDPLFQKTSNTENEYKYILQTDYVHPIGNTSKIEAGYKGSIRNILCDYFVNQQDDLGTWVSLPQYTDNLDYHEKIHSLYLMMSHDFGRLNSQAGLRSEYSAISTDLKTSGSYNFRDYVDFFPSASLAYELSQFLKLQLNYSYRLNRPDFRDLQPFNDFSDTRVLRMGNPDLNPEYIHSMELGLLYNSETLTVMGTLYDRLKKDVIYNYELTSSTGTINEFPVNLSQQNTIGFESNIALTKTGYTLNSNFNFYRSQIQGSYQNTKLESLTYTWTNRTTIKIKYRKCDFQTSMNYHAPFITPQGKNFSSYYIDLGLSRNVFNGNGTFTFLIRDLFNTQKQKSVIETADYYSKSSYQREKRQVMIALTFRLNKEK